MTRLIILRPEPSASETKKRAEESGLQAITMPLFDVKPVAWELPEPSSFDALLLSSANTLRHGGEQLQRLRGLKAYCVGQATADAARKAGFDIASVGKAGVERLLDSLASDQHLLHLAGDDRTQIGRPKQSITAITVYKAVELPPPSNLDAANGSVVLVHSSRAGGRFAQVADEKALERASICIAAISDSAAAAVGDRWQRCEAAVTPDERSLLELARSMCDTAR